MNEVKEEAIFMNEVKIKVEIDVCPELKDFLASLVFRAAPVKKTTKAKDSSAESHPVDAVPPATVEDVAPAPAPVVKAYEKEEIRRAVVAVASKSAEVKAKVKAALNKYAESVETLKSSDYAAFMAELEAL